MKETLSNNEMFSTMHDLLNHSKGSSSTPVYLAGDVRSFIEIIEEDLGCMIDHDDLNTRDKLKAVLKARAGGKLIK